ncbi:MarR family transcriptional regulator [Lutimaribacter sp. EGI FJ00015]|uniref:MarR family transcriptional regulator n=1 Tax=Lutimaribacter degradans TaxID=2945989 RepID=A0ACC5ZZU1_9RHOB|nr:MarR family transcriptional regulator [Lutimaribacter sp. EGI FJ00013]MCM2562874.1 MarR family transcriptional regulator [Lutimaribacter sp. EGI FJ00013]MCO0614031.1 MarR family transcriptional regulator [Lutimaribacter sp. EGI FJ00015]MCO0637003.1 MarR family transcriptional regulator [Lutimaribacter sp. EGI FJ00014]
MIEEAQTTPGAPPRLGEMGLDNFAPYLMNRIMGRYNASLREEMAALGLTTPQMRSLAVLSVIDGILIRELSVYAVVEQSTMSRALDSLVRDGLIRREADSTDSRATRIYLTDAGRATYERLWPHMVKSYGQMFRGISADEQRAFVGTLQKILRNVRVHDF